MGVDHAFQRGDGLRAVAVDGHDVGHLGRHRVEDPDGASAAFVHRGDADAVSEGRAVPAFERRDALDERPCADPVVAHARADHAGSGGDLDPSLEMASEQLLGSEILRDAYLRPLLGRVAEDLQGGDFRCGQGSHGCHVS